MKSILDKSFRYVPAAATDVAKTFARVRRQQQHEREQDRRRMDEERVVYVESMIRGNRKP